jgi:hypothetical protein
LQFTKQASAAKAPSALGQNVENISFAVPLLFLYRFTAQAENKVLAQGAFRRQRPLTFVKSHWSFYQSLFAGSWTNLSHSFPVLCSVMPQPVRLCPLLQFALKVLPNHGSQVRLLEERKKAIQKAIKL